MQVVRSLKQAHQQVVQWRQQGKEVGVVPTMGALHRGHLALAERSKSECHRTIVTIFVNPAQFGPREDFSKYPRTLEADLAALAPLHVDMVFVPEACDLYPAGFSTYVQPPALAEPLEGVCRPGHFRGVTTIVLKLFQILPATIAYFGQKDYQQLAVIRRMVQELNVPIQIQACETVRETDGLAMSSRNRYLNSEQRHSALGLWRALQRCQQLVDQGVTSIESLELEMQQTLRDNEIERIDYARVVDQCDLNSLERLDRPAVALIAAFVGGTRLIDNLVLTQTPSSAGE